MPERDLVLVDMDGTLADVSHRLHWIRGGHKKNWKKFFQAMDKDAPNPVILEWVQNLVPEYSIAIVSGRPEDYRQATIDWLRRYRVPFSELHMRRAGDRRPDHIVKRELLDEIGEERVAFVIDDRNSVCDMWRSSGLTCYQIAEGNF
jgi:phosphoglycolate phosphatase-like HAD superfamily hydrolase